MAIVAPTGVAAINAGGVTIHSFFQLPFGCYLPAGRQGWQAFESGINTRESLLKNLRLNATKRDVLRELEMLVIDEVSMMRADMLDAVDAVLRYVRQQPNIPFGGVQMIYIGDLYQLPPVVKNTELDLLREYYNSPFFFDAHVLRQTPPVFLELKKIYRQSDDRFIDLLNNIRNNCCTANDMEMLRQFYNPQFVPAAEEGFITLTSHNARADAINQRELDKLPGSTRVFTSSVDGDFPDRSYPAEKELYLKEGARVMFIKNDKGDNRRYFNGKLATITSITDEGITVSFSDGTELELERETWRNIQYSYNEAEDEIEEETLGTFAQYPIRLAWAITIHKSQGLTFDKAIVDAENSFAPGQVYVALSRLTSLQGLVLLSPINNSSITTDTRIQKFTGTEIPPSEMYRMLAEEKKKYLQQLLLNSFDCKTLLHQVQQHATSYEVRKIPEKEKAFAWAQLLLNQTLAVEEVADRFKNKLRGLLVADNNSTEVLKERTAAAGAYFEKEIHDRLLQPLENNIAEYKVKPKAKRYLADLRKLQTNVLRKQEQIKHAAKLVADAGAVFNLENLQLLLAKDKKTDRELNRQTPNRQKPAKGESSRISLSLFKEGKSIAEIAKERSLAPSTIEGHLCSFITTGEMDALELVTQQKLDTILKTMTDGATLSELKAKLGADFSFAEIRAASYYRELMDQARPQEL